MSIAPRLTKFLRTDGAFPLLLLVVFVGGILISSGLGNTLQPVFVVGLMIMTLGIPVLLRLKSGGELAFFLLVPTILSASQNFYLLVVARDLSSSQVRFLIVSNFIYLIALFVVLEISGQKSISGSRRLKKLARTIEVLLAILVVFALVSALITHTELTSAFASLRNFITPFLVTLVGLYASQRVRIEKYLKYFLILGVVVILFGIIELSVPSFWQNLGLGELWTKKGLAVNKWGVPNNFRASEKIGTLSFNRMSGPFADPVHLGTFLFAILMVAWFLKKRVLTVISVIAMIFTISKGALLGVLVFAAVWPRYFASRAVQVIAIVLAALGATGFYFYTLVSSTGSTSAHIRGLVNALADLPVHPFGRGLGNAGALASRFNESSSKASAESGLGVIMGQLGVVGLLLFAVFFVVLFMAILRLSSVRERCFALVLLLGFALNASFNEVALSPNSATPYFIMIGLLLGRELGLFSENHSLSEGQVQGPTERISAKL